jgi:hypothetical protein
MDGTTNAKYYSFMDNALLIRISDSISTLSLIVIKLI